MLLAAAAALVWWSCGQVLFRFQSKVNLIEEPIQINQSVLNELNASCRN